MSSITISSFFFSLITVLDEGSFIWDLYVHVHAIFLGEKDHHYQNGWCTGHYFAKSVLYGDEGLQSQTNFMHKTHTLYVLTSDHVCHTENTHLQTAFPYFWHTINKFENTISVNEKEAHYDSGQSCTWSRSPPFLV